jgi:hypothetical protein
VNAIRGILNGAVGGAVLWAVIILIVLCAGCAGTLPEYQQGVSKAYPCPADTLKVCDRYDCTCTRGPVEIVIGVRP